MSSIEKFDEFDGIQMGVMSDGTPFLSGRGLASFCGVSPTTVFSWGQDVNSNSPRWRKLTQLLNQWGFQGNQIFEVIPFENQTPNVYPEPVCMAFLEYYAYEADENNQTEKAKTLFRKLAGKTFREFVYALVGYKTQQLTFSQYLLSRINNHHSISSNPLPDGYFCLFDKMIEVLQKFDIRIGYQLGEAWYDTRNDEKRYLEPDISLGQHFSKLFISDFDEINQQYQSLYQTRLNNPNTKELWSKNLKDLRWRLDKASAERRLRIKHLNLQNEGIDSSFPLPESLIDRKKYSFKPAPESGRPDTLPPAYCYSNDYTSLFYEWLRDVFFKYVWRDYILERDHQGWMIRYNQFNLLDDAKKASILTTTEGKLIIGFEYRKIWESRLLNGDSPPELNE